MGSQYVGRQGVVHAAGVITGQIEGDIGEAVVFQRADDVGAQRIVLQTGDVGCGELDAGQVAMGTHAQLAEAERAQIVFCSVDAGQPLSRQRITVGKAGGQAGGGRFVPDSQAGSFGQLTDIIFRETGSVQRRYDAELPCGLASGAIVAIIVEIGAVGDMRQTAPLSQVEQGGEKILFAEVAAIRRVDDDIAVGERVVFYDMVLDAARLTEVGSLGDIMPGHEYRTCRIGHSGLSEYGAGGIKQIGRIDTAREGDGCAAEFLQVIAQSLLLLDQRIIHEISPLKNTISIKNTCDEIKSKAI